VGNAAVGAACEEVMTGFETVKTGTPLPCGRDDLAASLNHLTLVQRQSGRDINVWLCTSRRFAPEPINL
jgi:hypothetical protein